MDFGLAKSSFLCFIIVINLILCRRYGALIELGSHYVNWRTELFMYICIMNYIGTKGEVYATDRSKAVVSVLFLILCSFVVYITGRLMF